MPTHGAACNSSPSTMLYSGHKNENYSRQRRGKYADHKNCGESDENAFEVIHSGHSAVRFVAVAYRNERQNF